MTKEENIKKHNRITIIWLLTLDFIVSFYILFSSEWNKELKFHFICNQNTGEPTGIITSLFLYIIFWGFVGLIFSTILIVFFELLFSIIHFKQIESHSEWLKEWFVEFEFGAKLSFIIGYITTLFFIILHASNAITISLF